MKNTIFLLVLIIGSLQTRAFDNVKIEKTITILDGLSNSSITVLYIDKDNLFWIGTWDGLNLYNGEDIKVYSQLYQNPNSLSNNVITHLTSDKEHNLWISTLDGINKLNKETGEIQRFLFNKSKANPEGEADFYAESNNVGQIFCSVIGWGIGYYDGTDFINIDLKNEYPELKGSQEIVFDGNNTIWTITRNNNLFRLAIKYENGRYLTNSLQKSEFVGAKQVLQNDEGVFVLDKFNVLTNLRNGNKYEFHKRVTKIVSIENNLFCFLQVGGFEILTSEFQPENNLIFPNEIDFRITDLIKGKEGDYWLATEDKGFIKLSSLKENFIKITSNNIPELNNKNVRSFARYGNDLFVGTKGSGLFCIKSFFENIEARSFNSISYNHIVNNLSVYSMYVDGNMLWIGTDGQGISIIDLDSNSALQFPADFKTDRKIEFGSVYNIKKDKFGYMCIGTSGYGFIRTKVDIGKRKIEKFNQYTYNPEDRHSINNNIVYAIQPDGNLIWIGTRGGGLNGFSIEDEKFKNYISSEKNGISNNDVLAILKSKSNKIYLGTGLGLNIFEDNHFNVYTQKDGLLNNTIHALAEDVQGNIWMSSNYGLSKYYPTDNRIKNFTKEDNLQSNEFCDGACLATDGMIIMGGSNGFNVFFPQEFSNSSNIPDLMISNLTINNGKVNTEGFSVINDKSPILSNINLSYRQNSFEIKFYAVTQTNPTKCNYEYYLENFNKEPVYLGTKNSVTFTNIPPGKYNFFIKYSTPDGVWSKNILAKKITIKPAPIQSPVAYSIYGLIIISAVIIYYHYRKRSLILERNLEIARIKQEHEDELHQNKLQFFTNITHELQTPLTLITAPIEKLLSLKKIPEEAVYFAKLIHQNANRLFNLTQQILEFRKIESGFAKLKISHFCVSDLVDQIYQLFYSFALKSNYYYKINLPAKKIYGNYDQDKLEKIFFNLISNAFKYASAEKHLEIALQERDNGLFFTISNSIDELDKESIQTIFDQFGTLSSKNISEEFVGQTGIGLSLVKSIVSLLNGQIDVIVDIKQRITFNVNIPQSNESADRNSESIEISKNLKKIIENQELEIPAITDIKHNNMESGNTILVVEDEQKLKDFIASILREKYRVITASDGEIALKLLEQNVIDLIVSDIMMPKMNGLQLCKAIKQNKKTWNIPFVMLTAKNTPEQQIEGIESGADAYITKPFDIKMLEAKIGNLLNVNQKHKDSFFSQIKRLPNVDNDQQFFIDKITKIVLDNIDNVNLNSEAIEKELGMSKTKFFNKIKELTETSPSHFICSVRLKYAAKLLVETNYTVAEVQYNCGFNNKSYFFREFQKKFNCTPSKYRITNDNRSQILRPSKVD